MEAASAAMRNQGMSDEQISAQLLRLKTQYYRQTREEGVDVRRMRIWDFAEDGEAQNRNSMMISLNATQEQDWVTDPITGEKKQGETVGNSAVLHVNLRHMLDQRLSVEEQRAVLKRMGYAPADKVDGMSDDEIAAIANKDANVFAQMRDAGISKFMEDAQHHLLPHEVSHIKARRVADDRKKEWFGGSSEQDEIRRMWEDNGAENMDHMVQEIVADGSVERGGTGDAYMAGKIGMMRDSIGAEPLDRRQVINLARLSAEAEARGLKNESGGDLSSDIDARVQENLGSLAIDYDDIKRRARELIDLEQTHRGGS
ncbi:MAG: hypothetical protein KKD39_01110, partial [Candidatus Altiarchaeota archaeon]|nr:hypothetical protein [Candidatus Altiarchaeota archaeon]